VAVGLSQEIGNFVILPGGAEIDPVIYQVQVGGGAEIIFLHQAHRAAVGPGLELELGQGRHQAGAMLAEGFLATAGALAVVHLVAEAGLARALGFQSQEHMAEVVGVGDLLQAVAGFLGGIEEAVEVVLAAEIHFRGEGQAGAEITGTFFHQLPGTEFPHLFWMAVEGRLVGLHQPGLE